MKYINFIGLLLIATIVTGCANMFKGSEQSLTFNSEPSGATVFLDGQASGVTPVTIRVKKNTLTSVTVKKDGYRPVTQQVTKTLDPVAILDVFGSYSSTTSTIVDYNTGAAWEYTPNTFYFDLRKEETSK